MFVTPKNGTVCLRFGFIALFPLVEMPAGIDQLIATTNEDFRAAPALRQALSVHLDFVEVGCVNDDCVAINLHLCFRKLQARQFSAALSETLRAGQNPGEVRRLIIVASNCQN